VDEPAGRLSGGNVQKLVLARNLSREPKVIFAHQPTRGLDEGAIADVHAALLDARKRGAGVLLITEDIDELLALSDTVHVMLNGVLSEALPNHNLSVLELGVRMTGASA